MMFRAILVACAITGGRAAQEPDTIWREAYSGNFSLVHKLALNRPVNSVDDAMLNNFIMAYTYYRIGDRNSLLLIMQSIDRYIEQSLIEAKR